MSRTFPFGLGLLRSILAICVVISHTQGIPGINGVDGGLAVEAFFIISGFYMFMILEGGYSTPGSFYLNRFLRLLPIYFTVALASAVIYSKYGIVMAAEVSQWTKFDIVTKLYLAVSNLTALFIDVGLFLSIAPDTGRLFFSPDLPAPLAANFLMVPQGWSLGLEYSFYLIVPLFARKGVATLAAIAALSLLARAAVSWSGLHGDVWDQRFFPSELIFFVTGGLLYRFYRAYLTKESALLDTISKFCSILLIAATLWLCTLPVGRQTLYSAYLTIFIISLPFAFRHSKNLVFDRAIGELSYPIYICHMLVANIIVQFPIAKILQQHNAYGVVSVLLSIILSIALNHFIQEPVEQVRRAIRQGNWTVRPSKELMAAAVAEITAMFRSPVWARTFAIAPLVVAVALLAINFHAITDRMYSRTVIDLFKEQRAEPGYKTAGFGVVELDGRNKTPFLWGIGPTSVICVNLQQRTKLRMLASFESPIPGLSIRYVVNGLQASVYNPPGKDCTMCAQDHSFEFDGEQGLNIIEVQYSEWNGRNMKFAPDDPRLLTVAYRSFSIMTVVDEGRDARRLAANADGP
ncbi:acyltransferase family protein [Fundidesulfovibrio agrisoli]|uniref:acyltransferase family protein n=1 Tax=Fundidesulfovibrio agrisoli TaxID=2922717 RepID=UPI001FABDAAD|nr:acyltransferase [Fundidesulfovibrio agrisoli]